eukprot:CAMPEP_0206830212 /NCGR_PEP_ID=MMETSP0975-20121206/16765_1 /ASSEMBLY_ACC=CAM_ASM_000399 /TAXON_ID=483370 /ORGANISM="non described non described, Strain CCMP2097" /LENGTH=54 /DNA_ID=CAMNT_0054372575 /DNA_START=15 /DNA_END=176 /DNA_ORIENTATION=-
MVGPGSKVIVTTSNSSVDANADDESFPPMMRTWSASTCTAAQCQRAEPIDGPGA